MVGVETEYFSTFFFSSRAPTLPETESVRAPVPERRSMGGKFYEMFLKLAGADEVIDAYELRDLLSTAFKAGDCLVYRSQ